jgi:hypothetical protein
LNAPEADPEPANTRPIRLAAGQLAEMLHIIDSGRQAGQPQ